MATITKTYNESGSTNKSTWTLTINGGADKTASPGGTVSLSYPTAQAKYVGSNKGYAIVLFSILARLTAGSSSELAASASYQRGETGSPVATTSGTTYAITDVYGYGLTYRTEQLFNSSNPTVSKWVVTGSISDLYLYSSNKAGTTGNSYENYSSVSIGTLFTVTLNAPPTFNVSATSSAPYYTQTKTYSVNITGATAQCGGNITRTQLTIGSQTVTGTGNGTLSIALSTAGTFTPTVTVTDSRGQTTTKTLSAITVNPYTLAISSLSFDRINSNGERDGEGTNAVAIVGIERTVYAGNYLRQPTIKNTATGDTISGITWYTSWNEDTGFSGAVNWTNYAPNSPITLYGKLSGTWETTSSYNFSVQLTGYDSASAVTVLSAIINANLAQAFYLLAGRAGGRGLGAGMKPLGDNFYIGFQEEYYALDTVGYDKDLYDAIVALGWESDVIV